MAVRSETVRLIPDTGQSARAFAAAPLHDVAVLTLVLCEDGWWRVWGISVDYFPPASRVLAPTRMEPLA